MAKPKTVTLSKKDQKSVLSMHKKGVTNARRIASDLSLPRYAVMYLLESSGLAHYSDGSYM